MDLARVGIIGNSSGASEAVTALEQYNGFYQVAVAYCGVYDYRYGGGLVAEWWMGWPVGPWYEEQSPINHVDAVKGDLLLMVAQCDHTVDPAGTMNMAAALTQAHKKFELLVVPDAGHCEDCDLAVNAQKQFLVNHLLH
jgi:dipeptidyl aminopeptidase/acylaminoacyl peptidase